MWSDRQLERDGGCASLIHPTFLVFDPDVRNVVEADWRPVA
jgi:hypothetical protein